MRVSVCTPTVPGREQLLDEAVASVAAQTRPPLEHLTWTDETREGPGAVRNRLARMAAGDWLLFLDDDDLLDRDFLETLAPHVADADVVYPWVRVDGADWCPNRLFEPRALELWNYIPVTALVRRNVFLAAGGFDEGLRQAEDWDLWKRLVAQGARFKCVDEVLWTYRILRSGESRNRWDAVAAATAA